MATENKRLNTRILLKYDTYANWTSNNPVLLAGEVAIATIETGNTEKVNSVSLPQVLIKVGDGSSKYTALPFVSGLAADVYTWAKAASKPSYAINEISGAKEYTVVAGDDVYSFKLQARAAGSTGAYTDVASIDLSAISTRIGAVETRVTTAEGKITTLEGEMDTAQGDIADLKEAIGTGGSVQTAIDSAINALDANKSQTAGTDGLALNVIQENGVITGISGSIKANTYDAYGAASAVESKLNTYKTSNDAAVKAAQDAADAAAAAASKEATDRAAAINALDFAGVTGTQTGASIKFVNKVSQENGVVAAELGTLEFQSAISSTNKAATMADVTSAVADLNGAMHFEGVKDSLPAVAGYSNGDVIIVGVTEYVLSDGAWVQLGDEGALGTAIANLKGNSTGAASKTVTAHTQANGIVTLTYNDIAIAQSQVAGLETDLAAVNKAITDEEARAEGVEATLKGRLDAVQGTDTAKTMREVATEQAAAAVNALDKAAVTATQAQTIKSIVQANGIVTTEVQDIQIAESQVTGLTSALAAKATNTDLNAAKERITANEAAITKLNGAASVTGSVDQKITSAINALDKADSAVSGQVVTAVSQENGVISVSRAAVNVKDLAQTADTYVVFDCGTSSTNI